MSPALERITFNGLNACWCVDRLGDDRGSVAVFESEWANTARMVKRKGEKEGECGFCSYQSGVVYILRYVRYWSVKGTAARSCSSKFLGFHRDSLDKILGTSSGENKINR
jgi:hypothetical protein